MRSLSLLLAAILLFTGCATKKAPEPAPGAVAAGTPPPSAPAGPAASTAPTRKPPAHVYFLPWNWPSAISRLFVKPKTQPPRAGLPQLVGVIKMVNKEDQFVLIDAYAFQGVQPGDVLVCLGNQRETANLRLSTLRNPPFLIGDITSGSPSAGERVYKP